MEHSPLPYSVEMSDADERNVRSAAIMDADGKVICDTLNSDVAVIEEDWGGDLPRRLWDAQSKADMEFLAKAANFHERLVELCQHAAEWHDGEDFIDQLIRHRQIRKEARALLKEMAVKGE